jgi:murein endopeptidase
MRFTGQGLIPQFNDFLQQVPNTARVMAAAKRAQQVIDYIANNYSTFPDFHPLPADSDVFPHLVYGSSEKQFGGNRIIGILRAACSAHLTATSHKLNIGNMQWEHGGYMSPHVSNKEGIDADLVAGEVGIVPNHNTAQALSATREFLSDGAALVLFADQSVVPDANKRVSNNGILGHASYEASHTDHFQLRAPL